MGDEVINCDVAVIGAGIAGASIAAVLARDCRVVLIERESQPGYHTTGRSAALFAPTYGPAPIRALTRASAEFYLNPPDGFNQNPLLSKRGVLMVAAPNQIQMLDTLINEVSQSTPVDRLDFAALARMAPLLKPDQIAAGMFDQQAMDIDVHALHLGYLRELRARGGSILLDSGVENLNRHNDCWNISTSNGKIQTPLVVNAAGAWADELAVMAGVQSVGLVPKRRTVLIVPVPPEIEADSWPLIVNVEEDYYLKPDAGRFLISPGDETPSPACDAQPEELDIAICVDRIETVFDFKISRIENKWAGLRSFVADKCPVAGFDENVEGFFWLAGQGGYGIQSAPALSRLAAAMVLGKPVPDDIVDQGLDVEDLSPMRRSLRPD